MQTAEQAKPPVTRLLERYAGPYITLVLLIAACAWLTTQSSQAMLAVLVASCPCALVLAAPATAIAAIAVAARHGILIKGSAFLEHAAEVTSVVFDKTGTITLGELSLVRVEPANPQSVWSHDDIVRLAAALGGNSSHPVSRGLARLRRPEDRLSLTEVHEAGGLGVTALWDGEPGRARPPGAVRPARPADHTAARSTTGRSSASAAGTASSAGCCWRTSRGPKPAPRSPNCGRSACGGRCC